MTASITPMPPSPPVKMAPRFVRAPGAALTNAQAQLVGEEFFKIAQANAVDDVRALDKKILWETLEAQGIRDNPNHPLRAVYDLNVEAAAKKHWIDHTGKLMRSIRYEVVRGGICHLEPVWIVATIPPGATRHQPQRAHVLREDLLSSDPMFVSALGRNIRGIQSALMQLEVLTNARPNPPEDIADLVRALREVMTSYEISLLTDRAAE